MSFPTIADLQLKQIEKLAPQIKDLEQDVIDAMLNEGTPVTVDVSDVPNLVRSQVASAARLSGWNVREKFDPRLGDVLVIDEPQEVISDELKVGIVNRVLGLLKKIPVVGKLIK